MGMSATLDGRWTAAEVRAFPEVPGLRFECVDGELLVSPGPRLYHQRAVVEMLRLLGGYVAGPPRIGELSPPARLVERWLPGDAAPEVFSERISWYPRGRDTAFVVDLPALFREAYGEAP